MKKILLSLVLALLLPACAARNCHCAYPHERERVVYSENFSWPFAIVTIAMVAATTIPVWVTISRD